jgi:hypothetical protein
MAEHGKLADYEIEIDGVELDLTAISAKYGRTDGRLIDTMHRIVIFAGHGRKQKPIWWREIDNAQTVITSRGMYCIRRKDEKKRLLICTGNGAAVWRDANNVRHQAIGSHSGIKIMPDDNEVLISSSTLTPR